MTSKYVEDESQNPDPLANTREGRGTTIKQFINGTKEGPMCPACLASAAAVAGSVMSTGGIAAFAVKLVRTKKRGTADSSSTETEKTESERSNDHANDDQQ